MNLSAHKPFICIYASQVAMCIGANRHKKISEAMELMWQRIDAHGFRAALRRNKLKTEDEITEDIIKTHAEVRQLVDLTLTTPCDSSDEVARQYGSVTRDLRAVPLPEDERRLVDDVLKRNLYTTYGNLHETRALAHIRTHLGIACETDPKFYKAQQGACVGPWGQLPWYVGGKIDAIDQDRTLLIEIKNRVNRLFNRVPYYERVQVQAYLELLDLPRGILVECLKTEGPDRDDVAVNVIDIQRDRDMWTLDIVPKLQRFVCVLAHLLSDTSLQDRYLLSKRRSAMITTMMRQLST